jgi:hypothetical protein
VGLDAGKAAQISCEDATLPVYVVAADEETWIVRETVKCLRLAQAG